MIDKSTGPDENNLDASPCRGVPAVVASLERARIWGKEQQWTTTLF